MASRRKSKLGFSGTLGVLGVIAMYIFFSGHFSASGSAHGHIHAGSLQIAAEYAYAKKVFHNDDVQQNCLIHLWNAESGWSPYAQNSSGAYGIPQSLGHGHPYNLGDWKAQIRWGARYIHGRWGTPCDIWAIYCVNTPSHPVNSTTGRCWY